MKKIITIVIILLVALGFGYFLFKISPQQEQGQANGYNSSITENPNIQSISQPPVFDPATDHFMGDPKAKNVFIEYGDMQCPFCAQYNPVLTKVSGSFPDTVFVFRYFPLLQHQNTVEASLTAEAAGAQGKYWEMHDLLYARQSDWQDQTEPLDTFVGYAQQVGVKDINQFKNDVTSKKYLSVLQKGEDQAYALKLTATPTYFFNNHLLEVKTGATADSLKQEAQQYFAK